MTIHLVSVIYRHLLLGHLLIKLVIILCVGIKELRDILTIFNYYFILWTRRRMWLSLNKCFDDVAYWMSAKWANDLTFHIPYVSTVIWKSFAMLNLFYLTFLPRDAMHSAVLVIINLCLSVCLSICHTRGLCPHGSTYDHDFFTVWQPHDSSFLAPNFISIFHRQYLQIQGHIQVG